MDSLTELSTWRDVFFQAGDELATTAAAFLPRIAGAVLFLCLGWLVARLAELAASGGLRRLGLDRASSRVRLSGLLERAGVGLSASQLVGRVLFWAILLATFVATADTLGLSALEEAVDRLLAYVPNLIGAGLTLVLGLLLARLVGTLLASAAAAAGLASAARLGFLGRVLAAGLVVVLALEQLGVETSVLVGPVTALLAAAGFAAGLAFALGAHPIVTHILAGHFLKQSLPRDSFVEISGERGIVERVGPTDTVLRRGDRSWSVPNGKLIGEVVIR